MKKKKYMGTSKEEEKETNKKEIQPIPAAGSVCLKSFCEDNERIGGLQRDVVRRGSRLNPNITVASL